MRASQTAFDPAPSLTLADALARFEQTAGKESVAAKQARGAVGTLCRIVRRPSTAIAASSLEIDRLLAEVPRAARRQGDKTVANIRARLKRWLLQVEKVDRPPRGAPLTDSWAALEARLTNPSLRKGLSRLIRYASWRRIEPAAVDDAVLAATAEMVRKVNWGRDVQPFLRQTVSRWNEAAETVPGWPRTRLTSAEQPPRARRLALDVLPTSFREDVDRYLDWLSGRDRLADDGPARPAAPATLRIRREHLRLAASRLAEHLGTPERVTSLALLVEPANVRAILDRYLSDSEERRLTSFLEGLAATLLAVARTWVRVADADLEQLRKLRRRVATHSNGLTEKNRHLIRQLEDPAVRLKWLELPATLAHQAATVRLSPARRLQRMQIALAIELLLTAPMRMKNLVGLRLGRHVREPTGRQGDVLIVLEEGETKNSQPIEYVLGDRSKALLFRYLDEYRSKARPSLHGWLFVRLDGTRVPDAALRDGISKTVQREIGIAMTPHQFRHAAAAILLDARPGALDLVKDLLGHRSIKTTSHFYAGMRTPAAAREYGRILEMNRTRKGRGSGGSRD